jgi:ferritin-like metal-binding protein YciE
MKPSRCKPARSKPAQFQCASDEFETALVAELRLLRRSERLLQTMYPRLRSTPQLRARFVEQLAEMQKRAQRLDAVLNPVGAMQFAPQHFSAVRSTVA